MKVMIVVTHLLGTGHLARAAVLGTACANAGHAVTLVSGGDAVPRIDTRAMTVVQLPALRSDGVDFTRLLDAKGTLAPPEHLAARRQLLLDTLHRVAPDVLITELFPFGRRNLQAEFMALLEAAHALPRRPVIVSSVRDILAPPSKPEKARQAESRVADYYDAVLVHSDPTLVPLDLSWPVTPALQARLRYTGFAAPAPAAPHPEGLGTGEIIVSAGGGDVGLPIFNAAIAAAALGPDRVWRILVGGADATRTCARLAQKAGPNVIVEPARPEFRSMLRHAAASVSMCGYNTALDVLQAGTPAVWVPFDKGGEVEQSLRAKALSHLDSMDVIRSADLTDERLNAAVQRIVRVPRRPPAEIQFSGAETTVKILSDLTSARA